MDTAFEVLHALPGRVRVRAPQLKDDHELADRIAELLLAKPGVTLVRVNPACASVTISYDTAQIGTLIPEQHLRGLLFQSRDGHISVSRGNGHKPNRLMAAVRRFAGVILPTLALGLSLARRVVPLGPLYGAVAAAAAPIFKRAALTAWRERRAGVDMLDATAVVIMGIQGNLATCAFMAWLIGLGEHIRAETARRSEMAIADLMDFDSGTTTLLRGRVRVRVPVDCLSPDDCVVVNAGDTIPVDGTVERGRAGVDQRSLTGESAMRDVCIGDAVFAGSFAIDGELVIRATAVGLETRAGSIVRILRSLPAQETRIEDYAARFADRLVVPTFAASGIVFALTKSLPRALSMLIIDFGSGVRVAAPTAFLSCMAHAAHRNIVIKGGRSLEKLAAVDTVLFDKTGTLTTGTPEVKSVVPVLGDFTADDIISLAAAAEVGLNHPVANALAAKAALSGAMLHDRMEARLRVGMGVKALLGQRTVLVGSERLMIDESIDITAARDFASLWEGSAASPLYLAVDRRLAGVITYADRTRAESREVIRSLSDLGLERIAVLTGDREDAASAICLELGIQTWHSEVFPEQKLEIVRSLQGLGHTVAVVGDGVNDTLALAHADVAIAPFGATDTAKEAADVLLMEDDLRLLVQAVTIARCAMRLVKQNFTIVGVPNAAALALAAGGLIGPSVATMVNNGSTIAAGVNGLRPLIARMNGNGHSLSKPVCEVLRAG